MWQVSRATYLDIYTQELAALLEEPDSRERERLRLALEDEKFEFFAAVESGALVLGDTLLHVAARQAHTAVLDFLLTEDYPPVSPASPVAPLPLAVPNFRAQLPRDVVARDSPALQLALAGAADVHAAFGSLFRDEPKAHRLARALRRLWPRWMFEGQQEAALLVRVLCDARSSDAAFGGLVRVALLTAERCRGAFTLEALRLVTAVVAKGGAATADRVLRDELSRNDKLRLLADWFQRWFPPGQSPAYATFLSASEATASEYVAFFDAAAPAWLHIARNEPQLVATAVKAAAASATEQGEAVSLETALEDAAAALKRHELLLWKLRVRPPPAETDDLGTHISVLEAFVQLSKLKA